jgi:hypothetical protein
MAVVLSTTNPEAVREARRRLRVLERQAAQYGINVPPEIATEIEDLRAQIAKASAPATDVERHMALAGKVDLLTAVVSASVAAQVVILILVVLLLSRAISPAAPGVALSPSPIPATVAPVPAPQAGHDVSLWGGQP